MDLKKIQLKNLSSVFSLPLFRGHPRHAYGLAISDSSLELVNMVLEKNKVAIDFFHRIVLDPGIIARGYIRKSEKFAAAIKDLTKNIPQPTDRLIAVSAIPDYQVFTRLLNFPSAIDKETFPDVVQTEISKSLPVELNEIVIQTMTYELKEKGRRVMVFATYRSLINNWISNLEKCGIQLAVLEMASLSLIRSVIQECPIDVSYFLVDIGASSTDLAIFDCHGIQLSASMAIGGRHFTDVIAQNLKIDTTQAEEQKCTIGLSGTGHSMVSPLLEKELQPIAEKVNREISFFEKDGPKVTKIFLAGGTSAMPGIVAYFKRVCNRDVEQGHPWVEVESEVVTSFALARKKLPKNQEHYYTAATGLALRGLNRGKLKQGINFLAV